MAVNPGRTKSDEIVVYQCIHETKCSECGQELGLGDLFRIEGENHLCLSCSDLDHLVFLPSGNPVLTKRASQHSPLHAVVVRSSSSGKSITRQGILIYEAALQRAERECLSDEDAQLQANQRLDERRTRLDIESVKIFAEQVLERYPSCASKMARLIGERAFEKDPGIGMSETSGQFEPEMINLAVVDYVRHQYTEYDLLLAQNYLREKARMAVEAEVERILGRWEMGMPTAIMPKPDTDVGDFIEFDVFSPDKLELIKPLFDKHGIHTNTELLVAHLVPVLHEVLRGSKRRVKKSGGEIKDVEIKDPERLLRARLKKWLIKLEEILTDTPFMEFLELDQRDLEEKKNQLEADLAELESLKQLRGGKAKTIIHLLVPVVIILEKNGLNPAKRARFLRQLFCDYKSSEFGVYKNRKKETGKISGWDKAARTIANAMPQDLKDWIVYASLPQLTKGDV